MSRLTSEEGFSLVELLVAISLFSILSIGFYSVMFSGIRGGNRAESSARISEEARLGFNRLIRDTREADRVTAASSTSYTVEIDFDQDSTTAPTVETFSLVGDEIQLEGETLIDGVVSVGAGVFEYSSNRLQLDTNSDGAADQTEIENAVSPPANGELNSEELKLVSNVEYRFRVTDGDGDTEFVGQAQLRNQRSGQ